MTMKGTIKRVFLPRGFAFVTGDDGEDYFFQADELRGAEWDGSVIKERVRLEFVPSEGGPGGNGLRATQVTVTE